VNFDGFFVGSPGLEPKGELSAGRLVPPEMTSDN